LLVIAAPRALALHDIGDPTQYDCIVEEFKLLNDRSLDHVTPLEVVHYALYLSHSDLVREWTVNRNGTCQSDEPIHVSEVRTVVLAARVLARSCVNVFTKQLVLCDNLSVCLSLSKGRASNFALLVQFRRLLALSFLQRQHISSALGPQ